MLEEVKGYVLASWSAKFWTEFGLRGPRPLGLRVPGTGDLKEVQAGRCMYAGDLDRVRLG